MDSLTQDPLLSLLQLPYADIFNAMPAYALIIGRDLRIIEANKKFVDEFGTSKGQKCFKQVKGCEQPCENCLVDRTIRQGEQHQAEHIWTRKDGTHVHVQVNTVPITTVTGEVAAVMEMGTDITQIIRLKDRLQESEARYRELYETVPLYISVQDRDLRIVSTNRAFQEDIGDKIGEHCYKLYKHRDEPCMICPIIATFNDAEKHSREEVIVNNKGEKVNVLVHSSPIKNDQGEVEYVMEVSSDITQIRQLQSQLQSLGLLVGSISHGIKGVLTGLDGGIYVMNSGFEKDNMDRIRKGWDMIQRNVARIRSMVLDMLYYAKDREPNWQAVNPLALISDVCTILEPKSKEQGCEFRKNFDADLEEFEADPKALHSMLVNIIENSVDACRTDRSKETHFIEVGLRQDKDHVIFEVKDNGVGMDQETRERLFSLFFSSKGTEGTGLGLFISNKIAQQHGGIIVVDSEPGKGSHFTIRIPKRIPADMKVGKDQAMLNPAKAAE